MLGPGAPALELAVFAIILGMNRQHRKTLAALFTKPTVGNLNFSAIESLVIALGGEVKEGEGSRVALRMGEAVMQCCSLVVLIGQ